MLRSLTTATFWKLYGELPVEVQDQANRAYALWLRDPRHPSLRFKPFKDNQWSVRVGGHYRAVGFFVDGNTFVWTWIGSHSDYDNL